MVRRVSRIPHLFGNDYEILAIEPCYSVENCSVNPEVAVVSQKHSHLVFLESKKGANLEEDQLQRYQQATKWQWHAVAGFTCSYHDVVYCGKTEHADSLGNMLGHYGAQFPLQTITDHDIACEDVGYFKVGFLSEEFGLKRLVRWELVPRYVPIDDESSDRKVAEQIAAVILDMLVRGLKETQLESVCEAIWVTWAIIHTTKQKPLRRTVRRLLRDASRNELSEFVYYYKDDMLLDAEPTADDKIEVLNAFAGKKIGKSEASVIPRFDKKVRDLLDRIEPLLEVEELPEIPELPDFETMDLDLF